MMSIFSDMMENVMDIFMDDFSIVGNTFNQCQETLDKVLPRYESSNRVLNWEKCHIMVREGIVLGYRVSS